MVVRLGFGVAKRQIIVGNANNDQRDGLKGKTNSAEARVDISFTFPVGTLLIVSSSFEPTLVKTSPPSSLESIK